MPVDTYSGGDDFKKLKFSTSKQNKEMTKEQDKNSSSNEIKKLQCDLCKLSYPSEKALTEHLVSLMHHNKLGDEKNVPHCCTLCGYTCFAMTEYRTHITSSKHQNKLSILRGENVKDSRFRGNKRFMKSNRGQASFNHRKFSGSRFLLNMSSSSSGSFSNESFHDNFSNLHEKQQYNRRHDEENVKARGGRWGYNSYRSRNNSRVSHPGQDLQIYEPWGSGVFGNYRINGTNSHHQPSTFYFGGNDHGRIVSKDPFNMNENIRIDFTNDEWDEQSLIRQEQFLNSMSEQSLIRQEQFLNSMSDEPYKTYSSGYLTDKFENERRHSLVSEVNGRDRKRPREDNDVEELLPKSSKGATSNFSAESAQNLYSKSDHSSSVTSTNRFRSPDREDINETSNSLLKKAELLCKELREKRSEDMLLKNKNSDEILIEDNSGNDIQNDQSNLGKHFSNSLEKNPKALTRNSPLDKKMLLTKLDTVSEDGRNVKILHKVSTLSSNDDKNSNFADTSGSLQSKPSASLDKSKFSTNNSSYSFNNKDEDISSRSQASAKSPKRTSDQGKLASYKTDMNNLQTTTANRYRSFDNKAEQKSSGSSAKSPTFSSSDQGRLLSNKTAESNIQPKIANCDNSFDQERKSRQRTLSAEFASEKSTDLALKLSSQKLTVKSVSKDHLQKLVNAPRSRDERLKLAKLLHSREEHKAPTSSSARSNLQLEGLYDSEQDFFNADIDLSNISNDLTIKIEDLTDGVRQQIIAFMRDDSADLNTSLTGKDAVSADVTVPSDNDTLMTKGNNYKSCSPQRQSDNTCSDAVDDVPLSKKKKKTSKLLKKSESSLSAKIKRRAQSDHTEDDNQEFSYARCKAADKGTLDPGSHVEGSDITAGITNVNQRLNLGSGVCTEKTSSPGTAQSPLHKLGKNDSVTSSKSLTSTPEHADLNRDNVSLRYPLIMDTTRASDRVSMSPQQDSRLPPLSTKVITSTASSTSSSHVPFTSSSSMQLHSSQPLLSSRNVTLPPSPWLADRESPSSVPADGNKLHNVNVASSYPVEEDSGRQDTFGRMILKTDPQVIEISDETEYERSTTQSAGIFPEELLTLSEREEEIKQEMVSLDLRLSRLHRLLEQAVSQINKCTERRSQLLEETQVMSNKRITLLRENAAARLRGKTKNSVLNVSSSLTFPDQPGVSISSSNCNSPLYAQSALENSMHNEQRKSGTTLSKEDWLAKFSSFLPPESVFRDKSPAQPAASLSNKSSDTLAQQIDHPASLSHSTALQRPKGKEADTEASNADVNNYQAMDSITRKNAEIKLSNTISKRHESVDTLTGNSDKTAPSEQSSPLSHHFEVPAKQRTFSTLQSMSTISDLFSRPLVYLGSFKSAETLPLRAPVIMLNDSSTVTENNLEASAVGIHQKTSQDGHISLEDSDIGSSTSGSSLGEKISRYCKSTPDASLESAGNAVSPMNSKKKCKEVVKPCFVSLDRVDNVLKKGSHHTLDKKAAEALHLLERNVDSIAPRKQSPPKSGNLKKKKMKTRHQRDISDIKRQLRQRILSTSESSSGESESELLSECTDVSSKGSNKMVADSLKNRLKSEISPSKSSDVIIAECDSSTSIGVVDPQSIARRVNNIKEMQEKFDKVFGHATSSNKVPELIYVSDSSDEERSHHKSNTDAEIFHRSESTYIKSCDNTSKLNLDSADNLRNVKKNGSEFNSFEQALQVSSKEKKSRFPGNHGPVLELCVLHSHLYVAFCNYGVSVYDLYKFSKKPHKEMNSLGLQCMAVTEVQGQATVITGCGWRLARCNPEKHSDLQHFNIDVGTTVKCLLVFDSLVYSGLETGEICVFDIAKQKMELKDRFICSDHPIHCLAPAQEGSSRLICASSQDGTILVINSLTGLPLRILTGHSKTSFSLTVHGQLVFSGSGDSTVIAHNIHTGVISHIIKDNKGLVKTVFYHEGFLFTGGMDRLVRCYDIKNFKLTQVYYGAERTVICKIFIVNDMLITGNTSGSVDCVQLDHNAENWCRKSGCRLNFGNKTHLFWHIMEDHSITDLN
ncbi:hypothetical protein Btru_011973 [Bulinus truncatus]|nr:hypothetical protein Btru_011973 [Bulinus truncatus]